MEKIVISTNAPQKWNLLIKSLVEEMKPVLAVKTTLHADINQKW